MARGELEEICKPSPTLPSSDTPAGDTHKQIGAQRPPQRRRSCRDRT